ncbi:uroporphyrinogen-III C-methyltransferase [Tropicimonas sp.]|uniref:uroporphyrinogen-III C-methyltransferase n=1 Tax=Tropicimonas sp. TaxID=2067044 RepID=UPI003A862E49
MKDLDRGKVYLIGAGPGDPDLLTIKALRALGAADVVVYDRLVSPEIMALVPADVERIDVGKIPGHHRIQQPEINALLIELALGGRCVARLKGGDPLIFGRGSEEAADLARAGIASEYIPGITAAQGAAASTGVPLTHRGLATGVHYITGHLAKDASLDLDWARLADPESTLVIYMGSATIGDIAKNLMRAGMSADTPAMAVAAATTPRERHVVSNLRSISGRVETEKLPAPVLFVVGRVVSLYDTLPAGLPEAAYA